MVEIGSHLNLLFAHGNYRLVKGLIYNTEESDGVHFERSTNCVHFSSRSGLLNGKANGDTFAHLEVFSAAETASHLRVRKCKNASYISVRKCGYSSHISDRNEKMHIVLQ